MQLPIRGGVRTKMRHLNRPAAGYATAELLAGLATLILICSVAAVTVVPALKDGTRMECRYNMITISNIMRIHTIKDPNHAIVSSIEALKLDTPATPKCPDGGTYSIRISDGTLTAQNSEIVAKGQPVIYCSCPGHGRFAMDVDTH
jgi:hypothetical protein